MLLQLISCSSDRRYSLSSDFDFVSRNNFIVYEVIASEPPAPDDFLNNGSRSGAGIGGLTPNTKPDPKTKSDPSVPPQPQPDPSDPSVPPQPQPQPDPSDPSVPPQSPVDPNSAFCLFYPFFCFPQSPVDPQPPVPLQPPVHTLQPLQPDPQPPVQPPVPPNSFKYCDDFFDPLTGFDWSKLFSDEFSTCTWKSN